MGHASSLLAEAESGPADCNTSASARYHVTGRGEIMDKFIGHASALLAEAESGAGR